MLSKDLHGGVAGVDVVVLRRPQRLLPPPGPPHASHPQGMTLSNRLTSLERAGKHDTLTAFKEDARKNYLIQSDIFP